MSSKDCKKVFDCNGKQIKLYDVCKNVTTNEVMLVTSAKNSNGNTGLSVTNNIAGISDWLDVYPDGELEVIGNASISYG